MKTKKLIKSTIYSFVMMLFVTFLSCDSTGTESDVSQDQQQIQQEQQQEQMQIEAELADISIVEKTISGKTLRMIGDKVNVRSKPSLKGEVFTQLRINEVFDIKEKTSETSTIQKQTDYWYQIEKEGKKGWVFGALTTETLNEKEGVDNNAETLKIWGNKVNIRTKPSTKGEVIMQLNNGQTVTVKKQSDDYETIGYDTDYWYQIEVDGKRGWVFGRFTSRQLIHEGCSG